MNFQFNPWVDPRVEKVLMFHLETYLRRKGWKEGKSKVSPMRAFRDSQQNGVFLPGVEDDEFLRYAIDAVTELARAEDRYAGDVLTDLLSQSTSDVAAKTTTPAVADKGNAMAQPASR